MEKRYGKQGGIWRGSSRERVMKRGDVEEVWERDACMSGLIKRTGRVVRMMMMTTMMDRSVSRKPGGGLEGWSEGATPALVSVFDLGGTAIN